MILSFRGKAATGKTKAANYLKEQQNYSIVSKDVVFDDLLKLEIEWATANSIAYDKLAETIQKMHDLDRDLVVDIGLAHTHYFINFLSKMHLEKTNIRMFLFICGNEEVWETRIEKRIQSLDAPNQCFKSVNEARYHYSRYEIHNLPDEIEIDSAISFETMMQKICEAIDYL